LQKPRLLKKVDDGTIDGEKAEAWLCSSACREASIFLDRQSTASRKVAEAAFIEEG
jgi:hypothetical protein